MDDLFSFFMDESGFTGEDLLNEPQPVFVHVSTTLANEECEKLYAEFFAGTQAPELKHKLLSKRAHGQDRVVRFLEAIAPQFDKFTVWVCHKEFTLLTYLVDLWVEPAIRKDGLDLYEDGANLGMSNMLFFCLRTFESEKFLREHLRRFQRMMIQRTPKTYDEFFGALDHDMRRTDKRTADLLVLFLAGHLRLGPARLAQIPRRALDPAFTSALFTAGHWRRQTNLPLRFIHDNSSTLAKDKPLWDFMTGPDDIEQRSIGIPGREIIYPLNVTVTEFKDSRQHLQLQFCDVVAGASAAWHAQFLTDSKPSEYLERLGKANIESLRNGWIWPSPEVDPDEMGTRGMNGDGIEFLADQLAKKAGR